MMNDPRFEHGAVFAYGADGAEVSQELAETLRDDGEQLFVFRSGF